MRSSAGTGTLLHTQGLHRARKICSVLSYAYPISSFPRDCRGLCWASAALPSGSARWIATGLWQLPLHYVPSLSPHHAHLMRGYSSCACAVQQSSFSSLFPPAQTRAETLPSRKAWPRTTWVQAVQSSDEISSRSLWSVRGKACIPCRNGDTGPYWLSKFFCWDLAEISVALSHHTAAVTSVWWIFSLMPPCWDVFLWYLWTGGESWSRGWDDHRELQYLAHVFRKQSVLISMEFTIIPPLCLQVSCVSVGFGRSPYVEEFGPISPLCC